MMSIPSNKALGNDKIPVRVIKDCLPSIVPTINIDWKIAEVTSIPKEGDHERESDNRPISLLPVPSQSLRKGCP